MDTQRLFLVKQVLGCSFRGWDRIERPWAPVKLELMIY